jgi:hypothetical protein
MAMAEVTKTAVDPQCRKWAAMDMGMNTRRSDSKLFLFSIYFSKAMGCGGIS